MKGKDTHMIIKQRFEIGKTYLFSVPPGWLIAGTVSDVQSGVIYIDDGCYVESAGSSQSTVSGIPLATTPEMMNAACSRAWPLIDGYSLLENAVLMAFPCKRDVKPLARANDAATIKGVK
jgi:hypothetical protein